MRPLLTLILLAAAIIVLPATPLHAQDIRVKVDPNGPGSTSSSTDYTSVQQALDHAPDPPPRGRVIIMIVPGIYHERINVTRNRPRVTLIGLGKTPEETVITASQNATTAGGTFFTATAEIDGDAFEADNLTFENTAGNHGQAVAAAVRSDRAVFKRVWFLGDQDTLFADYGRQYYLNSYIAGGVDFIFGNATAVFDHSEIHILRPGYLTAQSRIAPYQNTGYVITNSRVTTGIPPCPEGEACNQREDFFLGRPWRAFSRVIIMNTDLPPTLNPAGWSLWKKDDPPPFAFYAEYHNTGAGAATANRVPWAHQLTPREALAYTPQAFLGGPPSGPDHWDPIMDAARLP
jgi:pectinesterase